MDDHGNLPKRGRLRRRAFLGCILVGGTVASTGCLGLFGECRDTVTIEEKAANPADYYASDDSKTMGVVGELGEVSRDRVIVDDGTGTAAITSGPVSDWQPESAEFDCARGTGSYIEERQDEYETDIVLVNGSVTQKDK